MTRLALLPYSSTRSLEGSETPEFRQSLVHRRRLGWRGSAAVVATMLLGLIGSATGASASCYVLDDHFTVVDGTLTGDVRISQSAETCISTGTVEEIVGHFEVADNGLLVDLQLAGLIRVAKTFQVIGNDALAGTLEMPLLEDVGSHVVVRDNATLGEMLFSSLGATSGSLIIMGNAALSGVDAPALERVGLHLLIENNSFLETLDFDALDTVDFDLIVNDNNRLARLDFPSLVTIGEDLEIFSNRTLDAFDFSNLQIVGEDLEVHAQPELLDVEFPILGSVGEDLEIYRCRTLRSIQAPVLGSVEEDVEIHSNLMLSQLDLPMLVHCGEDLEVYGNRSLPALVLPSVTSMEGDFLVGDNEVLTTLDFPLLEKVDQGLVVYGNASLESAAFPYLESIGALASPGPELTRIRERNQKVDNVVPGLVVLENEVLTSFLLPNLHTVDADGILVSGNPLLPEFSLPSLIRFTPVSLLPKQNRSVGIFSYSDNESLLTAALDPALPRPEVPVFSDNAPGFCIDPGPDWARPTCSGDVLTRGVDPQSALQATICDEAFRVSTCGPKGREEDLETKWLEDFCDFEPCPAEAGRLPGPYASPCFDLGERYVTNRRGVIEGSVTIEAEDDFDSLDCISATGVTEIEGCLEIYLNGGLRTVDLDSLTSVDSVEIVGNPDLERVVAGALNHTDTDLRIASNASLLLDDGADRSFPVLRAVGRTLEISDNDVAAALGFQALSVVNKHLIVDENARLASILLDALVKIGLDFHVFQNDVMSSLSAPVLRRVGEDLEVYRNDGLNSISMPVLSRVGEDLEIYWNPRMSIVSFDRLARIGEDLEIYSMDALTEVRFARLRKVNEDFEVFDNRILVDLDLPRLVAVSEDIEIYFNRYLERFEFPSLKQVAEDLILFENAELTSPDFPRLRQLGVREGGGLLVAYNASLTDLSWDRLADAGQAPIPGSGPIRGSDPIPEDFFVDLVPPDPNVEQEQNRPWILARNPRLERTDMPALRNLATSLRVALNPSLVSVDYARPRQLLGPDIVVTENSSMGAESLQLGAGIAEPAGVVDLDCNAPSFCVANPAPAWVVPVCALLNREGSCPAPGWREALCLDDPDYCSRLYYDWARFNPFDIEENLPYSWY